MSRSISTHTGRFQRSDPAGPKNVRGATDNEIAPHEGHKAVRILSVCVATGKVVFLLCCDEASERHGSGLEPVADAREAVCL